MTGDWFKDVQKELPPSPRRIIEEKIKILEPVRPDLIINDPEPNMKPSQTLTPSEPRTRMMVQHSNSHSSHQSQGISLARLTIKSNRQNGHFRQTAMNLTAPSLCQLRPFW